MKDWKFAAKQLEATTEEQVCAWAENHDWVCRKTKYIGRKGCPDRHFYGHGTIVLIEFKREDTGRLSEGQVRERKRLAAVGVTVHVCDTFEDAVAVLRRYM